MFGNNYVMYYLFDPIYWSVNLRVLTFEQAGFMEKFLVEKAKDFLCPLSKVNLHVKRVPRYTCLIEQMV